MPENALMTIYQQRHDRDIIFEADIILAMKNNMLRVVKNRDPSRMDVYPMPDPFITSTQGSHTHSMSYSAMQVEPWNKDAVHLNQTIEIAIDLITSVFFQHLTSQTFKELLKIRLRDHINNELERFKVE